MSDSASENDSSEKLSLEAHGRAADLVASRAVAVDRAIRGGALALGGVGAALVLDLLPITSPFYHGLGIMAASVALGAGFLWAGMGASHLVRYGKRGSALGLVSAAGLGGSILLQLFLYSLGGFSTHPVFSALSLGAAALTGFFMASLLLVCLVTVVKWMLPGRDPDDGEDFEGGEGTE
jgi:hypothetical protein